MSLLNLMTSSVLRRGCKEYNSKQTIEKIIIIIIMHRILKCFMVSGKLPKGQQYFTSD